MTEDSFDTRREEIRAMATAVFAAQGFASATMRDIAAETGILAGSLYHYFRSKDEILVEGLTRYYADSIRDLRAIVERDVPPTDMLSELISLAVRYLVERRDETTILHNDFDYLRRQAAFEFIVGEAAEVENCWERAIERGIAAGDFTGDVTPSLAYRAIIGAIFSTARWYDPTAPMGPAEFTRQLTATILHGLAGDGSDVPAPVESSPGGV
jgi:AcrR family transcriptional regulator